MTDEELKAYIDMTVKGTIRQLKDDLIKELKDDGLIKKQSDINYAKVAKRLYDFYQSQETGIDEIMLEALTVISDDTYFRIIPMYYRDQITIESLAVYFGVDISTIVRNKKRLCLRIYEWISFLEKIQRIIEQ
jgi:hypothetical protein